MKRIMKILAFSLAVVGLVGTGALANTIDLTNGAQNQLGSAAIGGPFLASWMSDQSTGTGVIDPFSRLQATGNEQGFNSSLSNNLPLDEKAGIWTHALQLSTVGTQTIDGVLYREFILDINETASQALLSLNQIQIFIGPDTLNYSLTPASATTDPLIAFAGYNEVFRMNNLNVNDPTRTTIQLNYNLNPGSGAGDMDLFIKDSVFAGLPGTSNVIFYSQFGDPRGFASNGGSNDGFEEWAIRVGGTPPPPVPEPATMLLLGSGLIGLAGFARKKFRK